MPNAGLPVTAWKRDHTSVQQKAAGSYTARGLVPEALCHPALCKGELGFPGEEKRLSKGLFSSWKLNTRPRPVSSPAEAEPAQLGDSSSPLHALLTCFTPSQSPRPLLKQLTSSAPQHRLCQWRATAPTPQFQSL